MSTNIWGPEYELAISEGVKSTRQRFVALEGQVLFALTGFNYTVNTGSTWVTVDGILQDVTVDYVESNSNSITLLTPLTAGQVVVVRAITGIAGATGDFAVTEDAATRAGKFLAFDASGDVISSTGTGADAGLRTDLAATSGASLVGTVKQGALSEFLADTSFGKGKYAATKITDTSIRIAGVDITGELSEDQLVYMVGGTDKVAQIKSYTFGTDTDIVLYNVRDTSNAASTVSAGITHVRLSIQSLGAGGAIVPFYPVIAGVETGVTRAMYPYGDIRRYGAVGDWNGVTGTDNTTAIQNWINSGAGTTLHLVKDSSGGQYLFDSAVALVSNTHIVCDPGAALIYSDSITASGITGSSLSNITIERLTLEGSGVASGFSNIELTSCTNVKIHDCDISKAGAHGIFAKSCAKLECAGNQLHNNYFYGVEDRDGVFNRYLMNDCYENGETGVATSTGGRGINVWRGTAVKAFGNTFKDNTEYGFRFYSENTDVLDTTVSNVSNNYFENNDRCDLLLYDEGSTGLLERLLITGNIVKRTTVPGLGTSIDIQGSRIALSDCHHSHEGTHAAYTAFNFVNTTDCSAIGCSASNISNATSGSGATGLRISNFTGLLVAKAMSGITGSGITLENSRFTHGGVGASDEAINNANATGLNTYAGNTFDGFHTGIRLGNEAVVVRDNTTVNSTFAGIRMTATTMTNKVMSGNNWDSASPAEISSFTREGNATYGKALMWYNAAPTTQTYAQGDRCFNHTPAVGNPKSWVCTVAGTPGTWVSEGNL